MKKQLVLGALVATTILQAAVPAHADKETIGNVIGGVIGGVIGSQIGKGNGNTAAIIIGTIAGTMIGGQVGRDMDEADRRALAEAQQRALRDQLGRRNDWDGRSYGSRTGARGSFTSVREGYNYRTNEYCREYTSVIYVNNRTEETRGVACSRADGSWYEVQTTEVRFNNGNAGNGGGYVTPAPRPQQPNLPPPPAPVQSLREGSVAINTVTRQSGGQWYRVLVTEPLTLDRVEVAATAVRVKIHEGSVVTQRGQRISIREFQNTPVFDAGSRAVSENLNVRERIVAIDLRMESYGGYAAVEVKALSNEGRPRLALENNEPVRPQPQPPVYDNRSLKGYCSDDDHQQFYAAKNFAYASDGLNLTDSGATQWALQYNQTHRCNTVSEYKARYQAIYSVAYASDGLNLTSAGARDYALQYVENMTANEAREMASVLRAAQRFAYASDGLNMTSAGATSFARSWVESRCEGVDHINMLANRFRSEYNFAYSSNGLNMTSSGAVNYAANKIAPLTRCGHLLRR
ncbi:beta-sandwich domain-containing protein [Bdellovibrio sp. HCB-162]|uniref:beta-sandwich domain-containing protein n=1 Tax=Bdellovibrio sp. HCB-162 TaxID=3394234 RepID=UPI0039BC88A8